MTIDQIAKSDRTVASVGDGVNQAEASGADHAEVIACPLMQE
jgi:cation transport ATPase